MALAAVIVAGLSARDAAVFAMAGSNPELAAKLAPANATAIVRVFDRTVLTPDGLRQNLSGWVAAAKQVVRADPLNAGGLRLLAYVIEATSGDRSRAGRIMELSERASRRDMLAQVWLIEDRVQRGDVAGALRHYDRALSVRPAMGGQLIPVLVGAASDPVIRAALVPYLRANRSWAVPFLSVAIAKSPDPGAIADLFRRYGGAKAVPAHAELETLMLRRLVQVDEIGEARSFAAALGAGGAADELAFTPASTNARFSPITWALYDGTDGDVSVDGRGGLKITLPSDTRIVAASRTLLVSSRRLVLKQRVTYPDRAAAPLVTWKAYCRRVEGPQRFWTRDMPVTPAPTIVQAPLDVPDGCSSIQIDIEATGVEGVESKAVIDRVELSAR